jgi:hypothetical protein
MSRARNWDREHARRKLVRGFLAGQATGDWVPPAIWTRRKARLRRSASGVQLRKPNR